ncbi:MAG: DUF4870 domain-containing protein [Chloroflexota bacterium]
MTEQAIQSKEDQLVAAISHAGALIPTFGLLIPLVVWLTQKDRSAYLKVHALQAAIWQGIAFLFQILFFGCYILSFFMLIPFSILAEGEGAYVDPASGGLVAGGSILLIFCLIFIYIGGGLIHMGFSIGGIVQTLRGEDFQYPFIGRWVNNRLKADADNLRNQKDTNNS